MTGGVCLADGGLSTAFPFHLAVDDELRIVQAGPVIRRLLPELAEKPSFGDGFTVVGAAPIRDHAGLLAARRRLLQLASLANPDLVLRGQFVDSACADTVVFVGSPVVSSMTCCIDLGLSMQDFALQDPVSDYLLLLQSQSASLQDATNLANAFAALNQQLEERVEQRTRSLATKSSELEALNGQLRSEIEDRQRIEAELRLAQKLESVGQLAAGIAHEINTPIQFIGDNLRFISDTVAQMEPVFHEMDRLVAESPTCTGVAAVAAAAERADLAYARVEVPKAASQGLEGVERVASLVRALKEFSHPDAGEKKPTNLNQAINTTAVVARNEYKYVAELVLDLSHTLPTVVCNPGEVNQVFLNLIVNAAHAIGDRKTQEKSGMGRITITTRTDGDQVEIRIADTGTGIPLAVRDRIFDPFFTTKPVGKGTGQGLYLSRSIIVGRHQGTLTFESELGAGTTFIIRLPVAGKAAGG